MSKEKISAATSPENQIRERLAEMGFTFGVRMCDKHKALIGRLARTNPELEATICTVFDMSLEELTQYKEHRYSNREVQRSRVNHVKKRRDRQQY